MRYRLKSDRGVTCEVDRRSQSATRGFWNKNPSEEEGFCLPSDLFDKIWEPVPEEKPVNETPAMSIEEQLENECNCGSWVPPARKMLAQAASEIRRLRNEVESLRTDRDLDRQAASTMAQQINEVRRVNKWHEDRYVSMCDSQTAWTRRAEAAEKERDRLKAELDVAVKQKREAIEEAAKQAADRDHFLKKVQNFERRINDCYKILDEVDGHVYTGLENKIRRVVERMKEQTKTADTGCTFQGRKIFLASDNQGVWTESLNTANVDDFKRRWTAFHDTRPRKLKLRIPTDGGAFGGTKVIEAEVIE